MNSAILAAAARFIAPVIFVVSLILLYRGHNLPGGGFIGGLIASTAVLLRDFATGVELPTMPGRMPVPSRTEKRPTAVLLMTAGLALAGASALAPVFFGDPFFTGYWLPSFSLPLLGKMHLGTPLVFDAGVYLAVIGFVVHSARSLMDESAPEDEKEGAWS
ncbi:MAG: MnhB domain-containing protein [Puniceicoccaceae bacterium]